MNEPEWAGCKKRIGCRASERRDAVVKKRIFPIIIVFIGLCLSACAGGRVQTASDGHKYKEKAVNVYRSTGLFEKAKDGKITLRFYEDLPNVPYVSVKDYYATIMKNSKDYDHPVLKVDRKAKDKYLMKSETGEAMIDVDSDVLTTKDLTMFMDQWSIIRPGGKNCVSSTLPFCRTTGLSYEKKKAAYDLGKYHIDIRADESDLWFPVATISDLTTDSFFYTAYNGKNFYYHENYFSAGVDTSDDKYYSVRLKNAAKGGTRPGDLTDFTYNELCFMMDYLYGRPGREVVHEDLAQSGFDAALKNLGEPGKKIIDLLHSDSYADYFAGISRLQELLEDGGHTAVSNISNNAMADDKLMEEYLKVNDKLAPLFKKYAANTKRTEKRNDMRIARMAQRDKILNCGDKTYVKQGDTAVCILDGFGCKITDIWDGYYNGKGKLPALDNLDKDQKPDPVLKVLDAVKKADADPEVKNLVIDITNNGGGETDEFNAVIAILTGNRKVTTFTKNTFTGVKTEITTEVDCNLDKKFDEKDNIKHDLNIGVLTSNYSYSAAHNFPMYMKEMGYPLLGEQTGGGVCAIESLATAEGFIYMTSSGLCKYVDKAGKAYDEGIPVDIDLLQKKKDGSVKEITMKVPRDPDHPEDGTVKVTMPDYSDFYRIDRLSKEMNAFNR